MKFIFGIHVNMVLGVCNQAFFAISPEKGGGWSWFSPTDKHESFLQDDSITLGVFSQACPKYPKQQVCYFFEISEEVSDGGDFLYADKHESLRQIDIMILMDGQIFPKFPNSKSAMSLQCLKKEVRDEVDFFSCR